MVSVGVRGCPWVSVGVSVGVRGCPWASVGDLGVAVFCFLISFDLNYQLLTEMMHLDDTGTHYCVILETSNDSPLQAYDLSTLGPKQTHVVATLKKSAKSGQIS